MSVYSQNLNKRSAKSRNEKSLRSVLPLFLSLASQGFVVLGEEVGVLLVGRLGEHCLLPQVRSEEGIGPSNSCVGGLG